MRAKQEIDLTMEVTKGDSTSKESIKFLMSKTRTIDYLKKRYPFPNGFWYALYQNNEAQMIGDKKETIKFKLEKLNETKL